MILKFLDICGIKYYYFYWLALLADQKWYLNTSDVKYIADNELVEIFYKGIGNEFKKSIIVISILF